MYHHPLQSVLDASPLLGPTIDIPRRLVFESICALFNETRRIPRHDFICRYLPYRLHERRDGRWLMLGRHYKPLGILSSGHFDYESDELNYCVVDIPAQNIEALRRLNALDRYGRKGTYLYGPGLIPWKSKDHWAIYEHRLLSVLGHYESQSIWDAIYADDR